ncbi:MAG TPA: ABC transporter substrate-binding protein, partial [bacterium]
MMIESELSDAKSLNPALVDEVAGGDIDSLVFAGLTRYNDKLELEPYLAEKWKVSKDNKVITYYLRKGVKFHDGVEFTADDVLFTYQVFSDPAVNTPQGAQYQDIKSVEILDLYTVKVIYKAPFAQALALFDTILPKHLLEGKDINTCDFARHPVGCGPYKFVEWKTDQKIVLEANPDYFEGAPHIKKFVMRVIPDQTTQFLELLNGGVDSVGAWLHGTLSAEQYNREINEPKLKDYYNVYKTHSLEYTYLGWNELNPLFKDKKVRQALTMAIDRQGIIQNVLYGMGSVCTGPFPYGSWANNPKVEPWPYDMARAKKTLAGAGWKLGLDGLLHKTIAHKDTPFKFTLITHQGKTDRERT